MTWFRTHEPGAANGTAFHRDVLHMSYADLVAMLGQPDPGDGDKTQAEWTLANDNGLIATIYDWKEACPVELVADWNIGAKHTMTAKAAILALTRGEVTE